MQIQCPKCGKTQEYEVRNPQQVPKKPKTKCKYKYCGHWIYIDKNRLININVRTDQKIGQRKNVRPKNIKKGKLSNQIEVLKLYKGGLYGSQIADKLFFPKKKIWSITRKLKRNGLIVLRITKPKIPKYYELTKSGENLLKCLIEPKIETKKEAPGETKEKSSLSIELWPYGLIEIGIHALRYKQPLIRKPSWLYQITKIGQHNSFVITRTKLENWDKFYFRINDYNKFGGLDNIEICNKKIIYNFKLRTKDSIVKSIEELDNFKESRINACIDAGKALLKEGFELGLEEEIELAQKPHFVILTENDYSHKNIGDLVIAYIKDGTRTLMQDKSNPFEPAHTETNREKDAKDLLEAPKRVENIENIFNQMQNDLTEIKKNEKILDNLQQTTTLLNKILHDQTTHSQVISNLNKTQGQIASNLALVTQVVHNLANQNERVLS